MYSLICKNKICGVVVSYNPDPGIVYRLRKIKSQVGNLIIVDNGSEDKNKAILKETAKTLRIGIIINSENRGIGKALNQGLKWARMKGHRWILTIDQDSQPLPKMVQELIMVVRDSSFGQEFAVVSAVAMQRDITHRATFLCPRWGLFYKRENCHGSALPNVSISLTSCSLHDIDILNSLGGFRDEFFIDYVDTEYCLRSKSHGYRIAVACNARFEHKLGERREKRIGPIKFFPTFHSPIRWYYISRNRVPMIRMYGLKFPHWLSFEIVSSVYIFFRMLLFENQRLLKLKAIFYGTLDGIRGRMGKIPPETASRLGEAHQDR